jgi:hypothetical protein
MAKIVYATCDDSGIFDDLVVIDLSKYTIINDIEEYDEGIMICYYVDQGTFNEFYYLSKVEIN